MRNEFCGNIWKKSEQIELTEEIGKTLPRIPYTEQNRTEKNVSKKKYQRI